jgi:hypothetical protein
MREVEFVVDLHLPMKSQCKLEFLQQIVEGKKPMLESYRVPRIKVPTWPELSVAKLLPAVMSDPILKKYFPDKYAKGKVPDRHYFWGVICAVKPGYFKALVNNALEQRSKIHAEEEKAEKVIQIKNDILVKMLDAPYWLSKHTSVN